MTPHVSFSGDDGQFNLRVFGDAAAWHGEVLDYGEAVVGRVGCVDAVGYGLTARPQGQEPTGTVATTVLVPPSITETVLLPKLAT